MMQNLNDSYRRDLEEWSRKPHYIDPYAMCYPTSGRQKSEQLADQLANAIRDYFHSPRN